MMFLNESSLVRFFANVFEYGVGHDEIERAVNERQRTSVADDS